MHMEMENSLPGCFSIILNQIESWCIQEISSSQSQSWHPEEVPLRYIPSSAHTSAKCCFGRIKACPLDAGPKSRITRKSSSSYRVVGRNHPLLLFYKNTIVICHSENPPSAAVNTACILSSHTGNSGSIFSPVSRIPNMKPEIRPLCEPYCPLLLK